MAILFTILIILVIIGLATFFSSSDSSISHYKAQREMIAKMNGEKPSDLLADTDRLLRTAELLIQADLVGDKKTAEAINNRTYDGPLPERFPDGDFMSMYDDLKILRIAGINYRDKINRYIGRVSCALVPEPNNVYDPNAIKIVAIDGHSLGYIPMEMTDFVRSISNEAFPYHCTAFIREQEDELDGHKYFLGLVYIVLTEPRSVDVK